MFSGCLLLTNTIKTAHSELRTPFSTCPVPHSCPLAVCHCFPRLTHTEQQNVHGRLSGTPGHDRMLRLFCCYSSPWYPGAGGQKFCEIFFSPLKLFIAFLSFSWLREAQVLSWEWITRLYSKAKVCFGFKKVDYICRSQCLMLLCLLKCITPSVIHADPQAFFEWLSLRKPCMPSTYSDRFL